MKKHLAVKNIMRFFALESTMPTSIQVFFIAAFFVSACNINSLGCCISSGSRCEALLTLANDSESNSLFLFNHIFYPTMPTSVKNATGTNNSSTRRTPTHDTGNTYSFDHDTTVEVVTVNGDPWFVAADVCRALGLLNPTDHIAKSLDSDEHLIYKIYRAGQNRAVNLISESGLYSLVVRSTKPNAKKFRKWVTSEVLPSIRKTGHYAVQPGGYVTEREYREIREKYDRLHRSSERSCAAFDALYACYELARDERNRLRTMYDDMLMNFIKY